MLKTENGYGFQATCGTPLSLGDKIAFSEAGNYCNGGGYATRGSGTVIGCGPAFLRVQCDDYAHRSVSNLGNTNTESAGVETLWFQGEYNPTNRCLGYAGTVRLMGPTE